MNKRISYYFLFTLLLLITSCSGTKYLEEGDLLYTGGKVKVESKETPKKERKALQSELSKLLRPKPNQSFLGIRPKLFFYNIAGEPKKDKGFRYWLKYKVGEAPVLFSQVDLEFNRKVLQNYSENHGYFNAVSNADSTRRGKTASADYIVKPGKKYLIRNITFPKDSSVISKAIENTSRRSLLKVNEPYDLDVIKDERSRIDTRLKQKGFYYFNPDYILVQVDSTVADHKVDLIVKVKNETPAKALTPYKINNIVVYPNYDLNADSLALKADASSKYKDFTIIDNQKTFKPRIFDRALYFKKDDLYNRTDHNLSLNRLVNMGVFKFVKNEFRPSDTTGNYLDAYYYITPFPRKSIRVEVLGKTNSANYTGTELNINWSNRNTFRGAELLTISAFGGLETQVSGQNNNNSNIYRFGSEVNLVWPRFISPFRLKASSGFVPKTKATLGFEYQNRKALYALTTFRGSFGYLWKENERKEHQLNITEITYASPQNVTAAYQAETVKFPALKRVIEKQLIFGPTYSYTYTNTMQKRKKHTFYYRGGIDLSGNIVGLVTGANVKKGDTVNVLGVPFSQFVKVENEFRHYIKLGGEAQLASRIIAGAGFAYGNSSQMPFIKQFFIGGTNSIRAFRARSIGPGSFKAEETNGFLPDQSGDMKLELNTEYRGKIYSIVKGAVFVDAGNIWLRNTDPDRPGAEFSKNFIKELAVGVGAGLRFDLSFLVLRTDLAFPIRKPYLPEGQRWVLDQVSFGNSGWRKENLVFNLAIGYPF
jgi:outer membrane protein assembly factor BamA